jgi:hypothetical protein
LNWKEPKQQNIGRNFIHNQEAILDLALDQLVRVLTLQARMVLPLISLINLIIRMLPLRQFLENGDHLTVV